MGDRLKIFIIFLFFFKNVFAVDIGSDSFVERCTVQRVLNNGDRVASFAFLKAGFKLNNNAVSATFDSCFPVMGTVELEGGTLSLSKDLIFNDVSVFKTLGNIAGNNHKIVFAPSMSVIPTEVAQVDSCGSEACDVTYVTQAAQSSDIRSCDWSFDNKFIAIGLAGETYSLKIYEFNGSTLTLKDSEALENKHVYDVSWHPSDHLLAVVTQDRISNNNFLVYEVNATTGVLTFKSGLDLSGSSVDGCAVDWHPTGDWIAVGSSDSAKEIAVYAVDSQGILTSTPVDTYNTDASVKDRAICWDSSGNYLAVGLNSFAANELLVLAFNQGTEEITLDCSENIGITVLSVSWSKVSPQFLAVGLAVYNGSNGLRVYEFDSGSSTLTQRKAITVSDYVDGLDWHPSSNCLAMVRESDAAGKEFRVYYFDSSDYSLDLIDEFEFSAYTRCVSWSHDGGYIVHGCDDNKFYVYSAPSCASGAFSEFEFDGVKLFLNSDVTLNSALIKFKSESIIHGKGNTLDLNQTGTIVIDANASLTLKDITIKNIKNNSIYCTDSTSTLLVDNCKWELAGDYDFDAGHLEIFRAFNIIGDGYNFSYKTDQQSIIKSNAKLILDENLTFKYDPSVSDRDLLSLYDSTSEIILRGATLFSTIAGLRLTKGNLLVENKSYFSGDGTNAANGISLGDGVSAANNLTVKLFGAANLEIIDGYVLDNNV